jgi:hypothetical protein
MTTDDVRLVVREETGPRFEAIEKKLDDVLNFMNTIMKRFADWEEERVLFRGQRDSIEDLDIRLGKLEKVHQNPTHTVSAS